MYLPCMNNAGLVKKVLHLIVSTGFSESHQLTKDLSLVVARNPLRETPKGINLHVLNDERCLKVSWIWLSIITAQGEWLQVLYPVCG